LGNPPGGGNCLELLVALTQIAVPADPSLTATGGGVNRPVVCTADGADVGGGGFSLLLRRRRDPSVAT
jgi:hypothetical protein